MSRETRPLPKYITGVHSNKAIGQKIADASIEEDLPASDAEQNYDDRGPPGPPAGSTPLGRKLAAKRINEHVKSFYSFANTLGAATIGAAYIVPAVTNGTDKVGLDGPSWVAVGVFLHIIGHLALRLFMRSEE
jgi:hypothetical protein